MSLDDLLYMILFNNKNNNSLDVCLEFLDSPFDMFNFFIHILIKSFLIVTKQKHVNIDEIDIKDFLFIKDRFSYTGIDCDLSMYERILNYKTIFIKQVSDFKSLEDYVFEIHSNKFYRITFKVCRPKNSLKMIGYY